MASWTRSVSCPSTRASAANACRGVDALVGGQELSRTLVDPHFFLNRMITAISQDPTTQDPISQGHIPTWAWGWGDDVHGVFADLKIGDVVQRMRWIPPGTFLMGSPDDEAGRADWEGPLHQVELTQGFWLADTPCTQALWQEVMGENPSRFLSPTRPVERVSWEDCHRFFERVEQRQPGLDLRLPTEAQWEHACRAGTTTATWLGDLDILGERNAPGLDIIAWYGGNSGVDFDLEGGYDTSDWQEMQAPNPKAGTRNVKWKPPNPWGFYDMLGNVWEWCVDSWNWGVSYPDGNRIDPVLTKGSDRVIRGGSWSGPARSVRAACRYGDEPGRRSIHVGFRLSRGPEDKTGTEPKNEAEPEERPEGRPPRDEASGRAPGRGLIR